MHMADALISPAVGGTMWAVSAGLIFYSSKKIKKEQDDRKVPLMGVMGAFIFAAQMINFAIPGTGSSGHLGGGMILAILLGPYAAFLAMSSVLMIQALFFADGGLLALGCNIFNLGFFPCFVAYPLIYRKIAGAEMSRGRIMIGSLIAAILALQMGSFLVVLQTFFSGITELPFGTFVLLMQPIHFGIGLVEGFATAAVIAFVFSTRPEILEPEGMTAPAAGRPIRRFILGLLAVTMLTGGILSWFASGNPDGLEWSMFKTSGSATLKNPGNKVHNTLNRIQDKTAFLPDYSLESGSSGRAQPSWPSMDPGTSWSGLIGSGLTLFTALLIGLGLRRRKRDLAGRRTRRIFSKA